MASETIPRQPGELVVDVAVVARKRGVNAAQLETAGLHVVEESSFPALFVVANRAILGKSQLHVGRVGGLLEISGVAAIALRGSSEISIGVATVALHQAVRSPQFERGGMLKGGIFPLQGYRAVAGFAVDGKACLGVVGIICQRVIGQVAAAAIHRGSAEFIELISAVAGLAVGHGVNPGEGKSPGGVQLQNFLLVAPTIRGVAILAIQPELAAMHVGVAVRAGAAHFGEFQALVAANAIGELVRSLQQEAGIRVFEGHGPAEFFPGFGSVAALAIPFQKAVRALGSVLGEGRGGKRQEEQGAERFAPCAKSVLFQTPFHCRVPRRFDEFSPWQALHSPLNGLKTVIITPLRSSRGWQFRQATERCAPSRGNLEWRL